MSNFKGPPNPRPKPRPRLKLMPGDRSTAGDWPEDFHLENGNYYNYCTACENEFIGHKRRRVCKVCQNATKLTKWQRLKQWFFE